jgi:hypothetical protein
MTHVSNWSHRTYKKLKKSILTKSDFGRYVLKHPYKTLKAVFFWIMETWPRRLLASLVIIVLIFGPISFLFKPGKAEAAWWNDSWAYRKSIQITNNTTAQTNVYVTVSLDTSDTTRFKTTCGDLRFTQVNGKVMPYYLASGCGTGSTSILVAFDVFPAGAQTIYYYYGNPNATDGFTPAAKTGSVTQANMRLSIVANTAFVDFSAANTLTMFHGNRLVIIDHTAPNKTLTGYIKAAGTGETTDSELITNSTFDSDITNWSQLAGNTFDTFEWQAGTLHAVSNGVKETGNFCFLGSNQFSATSGWLLKIGYTVTKNSGSASTVYVAKSQGDATIIGAGLAGSSGTYTYYRTATATQATTVFESYIASTNSVDMNFDNVTVKRILTPSATGVTITSTSDGATYTWANEDGSFNRNDSSDYTYIVYPLAFSTAASNYTVGALGTEEKTTGPVGYWAFDEGYSTVAHDETSNKNDGALDASTAAPTWKPESECVSGKCLGFDGTNDDVYANDTGTSLDFTNTSQYTFSSWIKYNGAVTTTQCFLSKDGPNAGKLTGFNLCLNQSGSNADVVVCKGNAGTTLDCSSGAGLNIPANEWNNIAVTYDGASNWGIYKNGKSMGTINYAVTSDTAAKYYMGAGVAATNTGVQVPAYFFKGNIDEVKVYNYSRSAAQIQMDYNTTLQGSNDGIATAIGGASQKWMTNGLVGYWKMDESSGTAVADASGNSNAGTLTSAQETDTATAASTTTLVVPTSGASLSATDDAYNGMILNITGGGGCGITTGVQKLISDYTGASKTFTVSSAFLAEADNCTFEIRHQTGGKFGNGLQLDGDNDYVTGSSTSFPTASGTIDLWYKPARLSTDETLFMYGNNWYNNGMVLIRKYSGDNMIHFVINTQANVNIASAAVVVGTWYHVVATYKTNECKLFVNGVQQGVTNTSCGMSSSPGTSFYIGKSYIYTNEWLKGSIDDVRLYNRVLSPDEAQKLYTYAPGPVGQWKFDEKVKGNNQTVYDSSGNGNNGTTKYGGNTTGMDCTVPGKLGSGCSFDGTDDYVDAGNGTTVNLTTQMTLSAWVKLNVAGQLKQIIGKGNAQSPNTYGFDLYSHTTLGYQMHSNNGGGGSSKTISTGAITGTTNWNYVTGTFDGSQVKIYLNGIQKNSSAFSDLIGLDSHTLQLGGSEFGTATLSGYVDDVRVYNYARSPEQIQEDMQGDVGGGVERNGKPMIYYRFDEGYGTVAHNDGIGGSTMNGTLAGSPVWTNDGEFGKALDFNASGKKVTVDNPFDQAGTTTATLWYKRSEADSSGTWRNLLADKANNYHHLISQSSTRSLGIWDGSFKDFGYVPLIDGKYHYYAVVYVSATSATLYVDGKYVSQIATTLNLTTYPIGSIGNWNSGTYWGGYIDEVKIFNYGLTPDEIKADYDQGSSMTLGSTGTTSANIPDNSEARKYCPPGNIESNCNTGLAPTPVGEWNFDEKVSGTSKTLHDTSGNGNDVTTSWGANATGTDCTIPGKIGTGCWFDGVDDYGLTSPSSPGIFSLNNATTSATAEFWINTQTGFTDYKSPVYLAGANTTWAVYALNGNKLYIKMWNDAGTGYDFQTYYVTVTSNQWIHATYVMSLSGGNMTVTTYQNGQRIGAQTQGVTGTFNNGGNPTMAGGSFGKPLKLDQVRIFGYTRTPAQIAFDYNKGGPIAYWAMDECQGATIHDESGNSNVGTLQLGALGQTAMGTCADNGTTPWYVGRTGKYSASINLDGQDDYVDFGASSLTNFQNNAPFSISLWMTKNNTGSFDYLFQKRSSSTSAGWALYTTDTAAVTFLLGSTGALKYMVSSPDNSYSTTGWYHVTVTYDGSQNVSGLKMYINGVEKTLTVGDNDCGSPITYSNNMKIGIDDGLSSGAWFQGQIDDVKVFNYTLTTSQVKALYNNGAVSL